MWENYLILSINKPLMCQTVLFLPTFTLKFHIQCKILGTVTSQDKEGSNMLYGETSIAFEVVHNLPDMYKEVERSF